VGSVGRPPKTGTRARKVVRDPVKDKMKLGERKNLFGRRWRTAKNRSWGKPPKVQRRRKTTMKT